MAGDKVDAGTRVGGGGGGGAVNSLRKLLVWEDEEDSPSDMTFVVLGLIGVEVGDLTDAGGSGRGHEGGGEIGGNDFLDTIDGGGVYNNDSNV